MFTKNDYATLTASQHRGRTTRTLAKRFAQACVPVVAIWVVADLVEKALDSKTN